MAVSQVDIQPVLIEQVENRLIDAIIDGTLGAGERITQEAIAEMLGVSRQPVSHALQALKRRGLLIEHGKRGLAVAPLDAQRLLDHYQVRAALDALAARLAAEQIGRRSRDEITAAETALARGQALPRDAPVRQRIDCDVAFHIAIYGLSGNPAIGETVGAQWVHFMRSMVLVLDDADMRSRVWTEHQGILEAVLRGDADGAAMAAHAHALRAGEATLRRLERAPTTAPARHD